MFVDLSKMLIRVVKSYNKDGKECHEIYFDDNCVKICQNEDEVNGFVSCIELLDADSIVAFREDA